MCTEAIQRAIDAACEAGGETVVIPRGEYVTGTLNLRGASLCLEKGAIIRGCNVSAGDDCIALTCITDWNKPCQDFTISDCVLRSCSKAIVIGYMHSIVRNVTVTNAYVAPFHGKQPVAYVENCQNVCC